MSPAGTLAFATTHRVIYRIHGDTPHMRSLSCPSGTTSFSKFFTFVLTISNLTNACSAEPVEFSYFS
jgi:hypothetical protein